MIFIETICHRQCIANEVILTNIIKYPFYIFITIFSRDAEDGSAVITRAGFQFLLLSTSKQVKFIFTFNPIIIVAVEGRCRSTQIRSHGKNIT